MTATRKTEAAGSSSVVDMAAATPSGVIPEAIASWPDDAEPSSALMTVAINALPSTEPTWRVEL